MKDVVDIHGFNGLRWEDQQKIKDKLTASGGMCYLCWLSSGTTNALIVRKSRVQNDLIRIVM